MPSETLQGVVLRYANYRDRDRMLTLLTPQRGRVDVLSRGCRKPNSQLMPASELFVHGEFVLFRSNDRYTLTSCNLTDTFYPLRVDPYRLTCASYLLALASAAVQQDQPASTLYSLLLKGLYHLTYVQDVAPLTVTNLFILLYAVEIGYRPRLNHCVRCHRLIPLEEGAYLDAQAGGLCCKLCAREERFALTAAQINWMRAVLKLEFEAPMPNADAPLFEALRYYIETRLETPIKCSQFLP